MGSWVCTNRRFRRSCAACYRGHRTPVMPGRTLVVIHRHLHSPWCHIGEPYAGPQIICSGHTIPETYVKYIDLIITQGIIDLPVLPSAAQAARRGWPSWCWWG